MGMIDSAINTGLKTAFAAAATVGLVAGGLHYLGFADGVQEYLAGAEDAARPRTRALAGAFNSVMALDPMLSLGVGAFSALVLAIGIPAKPRTPKPA